jgi:hypothetical protein
MFIQELECLFLAYTCRGMQPAESSQRLTCRVRSALHRDVISVDPWVNQAKNSPSSRSQETIPVLGQRAERSAERGRAALSLLAADGGARGAPGLPRLCGTVLWSVATSAVRPRGRRRRPLCRFLGCDRQCSGLPSPQVLGRQTGGGRFRPSCYCPLALPWRTRPLE